MEITAKYSPEDFENKWYTYWLENDFFSSTPDERTPYTIVIPPPNVTGILHMGHMFLSEELGSKGSMLVGCLVLTTLLLLLKQR